MPWWTCPHPVLVDLSGTWHRVWCPYVLDWDDPDFHQHIEADEVHGYEQAPGRCRKCWPELRITSGP